MRKIQVAPVVWKMMLQVTLEFTQERMPGGFCQDTHRSGQVYMVDAEAA